MASEPVDRHGAAEFEDEGVVETYAHRPAYPDALIARLLALMPSRGRVLDLGCGPGKLAWALFPYVTKVVAVDPSAAMLRVARGLGDDPDGKIQWVHSRAEDLELCTGFDLAVAGASIHWMEPAILFPKLAAALAPRAPVAIVNGDAPTEAPWISAYEGVVIHWVERLGGRWKDERHRRRTAAHEPWLPEEGREHFVREVTQSLEDLIACEHSRATWSRRRMGPLAEAFDADLRVALSPWTRDGLLTYEMETSLTWGFPASARGA